MSNSLSKKSLKTRYSKVESAFIFRTLEENVTNSHKSVQYGLLKRELFKRFGTKRSEMAIQQHYSKLQVQAKNKVAKEAIQPVLVETKESTPQVKVNKVKPVLDLLDGLNKRELLLVKAYVKYLS